MAGMTNLCYSCWQKSNFKIVTCNYCFFYWDVLVYVQFDKELQERWDAAVDAGCFSYKLLHVEGRVVPGKYQLFIQVNTTKCSVGAEK